MNDSNLFCPDAGTANADRAVFTANIDPATKGNIEGLKAVFNRSNAELLTDLTRFAMQNLPPDRLSAFGEAARAYAEKQAAK